MALAVTSLFALVKASSAFVPTQGNLRNQVPSSARHADLERDEPILGAVSTSCTGTGIGLSAAAAALLGLAATQSVGRKTAPRVARNVVGICEPLAIKWDPLNLGSTDAKMERYTVVEVKHGRIAMIACVGYLLPTYFRFPGCENFKNGLGAFDSIPPEGWAQIFAFIGAHEIFVRPRQGGMGGYDLGLGTEIIEGVNPAEVEWRQTIERNNGRLAMVGIMGLMVQDGLFGVDPMTYLIKEGWWGQPVDWLVKDLPMCAGAGSGGCALMPRKPGPGLTAMRPMHSSRPNRTARKVVVYEDPLGKFDSDAEPKMSPALPWITFPQQLEGWVGGEVGWDPLFVTMALPVYLVREAELKHGRTCMLAVLGWVATDLGARFPADIFQKATTISAHDDMVAAGLMQPFLAMMGCMELYGGFLLVEGMKHHLSDGGLNRDAGDYFVGKRFLPQDLEQANSMKLKELKNGRLAMLGFSGIVTQAVLTNSTFPFF